MSGRRRTKAGFGGAWCVPELFASAFEGAVHGLAGEDLARLVDGRSGAASSLGWVAPAILVELEAFLAGLRQREPRRRYLVTRQHQDTIRKILGDDFRTQPRKMLVLALALDDVFDEFLEDVDHLPADMLKRTTARAEGFFDDATNKPPAIGQMTSIAVCRGWFRRFWYTGNITTARAFGPMPRLARVRLPNRTGAALATAVEMGEFRTALSCWPGGGKSRLQVDNQRANRFAVPSRSDACGRADFDRLVDVAATSQAHVLLLPEIALTEDELGLLKEALAAADARFPALVVAGLTHRRPHGRESYVNEAVCLTSAGEELFRHEKLEPFSDSKTGRFEDIVPRQSEQFHYIDTPIGRLTINVCRDYRSDIPMFLNRVLGATGVLVPAHSKRLDFASEEARALGARQGAFTLVVNPWCCDLRDAVVAYFPIVGEKAGHATLSVEADAPDRPRFLLYRVSLEGPRKARLYADPPVIM